MISFGTKLACVYKDEHDQQSIIKSLSEVESYHSVHN